MGKVSKMIGAGTGSAVGIVAAFLLQKFVPGIDPQTADAIKYLIYTAFAAAGAYAAPANTQ